MFRVSERFACRVVGQHRSTQRHATKVVDIEGGAGRSQLSTSAGVCGWRIACSGEKAGW